MLQLFINDNLVDLTDDSPIALTFQINNLAEVKNQQGNTSNQFKLPLTQRNRQILGFPDEVAFTDDKPYQQYAAKLVQDGMEIVPVGVAELNTIDNNTASITVLSGNVDFFDAIDGKLYDVGDKATPWFNQHWRAYDHDWTIANVVASQKRTEGWIWPIVDYGRIPEKFNDTPNIDIRYLRPGFFLKTATDLILKPTGYTINPNSFLVKDELYNKLIVQFANDSFEHGASYDGSNSNLSITAQNYNYQEYVFGRNGANEDIRFPGLIKGSSNVYNVGSSQYIAKADMDVNIIVDFAVHFSSDKTDGAVTLSIKVFDPTSGQTNTVQSVRYASDNLPRVNGSFKQTYYDQKLTSNITLTVGQVVKITYDIEQDVKKNVYFKFYSGSTFTITEKQGTVLLGQQIQCERIFPDISQKDLLKDTLQRFGIICQTDTTRRQITLASFRDIVNNIPQAKDWTSKCLDQGKTITFQLGGYAQTNFLKYKEDDNILPKNMADGQILVQDKTLPATGTLFESQFAPTLNRPYIDGTIAQIKKVDTSTDANAVDFSISTQPRLLIHDTIKLNDSTKVKFIDGTGANQIVNDTLCVPYFDKGSTKTSLMFERLRQQYYPELEKILHHSKKVVRWFLLTPRDILELDLLIPVYLQQDGAYYYINKIDSWRKGQATKVELVKLG
jgi:hypothetical protein